MEKQSCCSPDLDYNSTSLLQREESFGSSENWESVQYGLKYQICAQKFKKGHKFCQIQVYLSVLAENVLSLKKKKMQQQHISNIKLQYITFLFLSLNVI